MLRSRVSNVKSEHRDLNVARGHAQNRSGIMSLAALNHGVLGIDHTIPGLPTLSMAQPAPEKEIPGNAADEHQGQDNE
jgi:hypothetical protein